MNYLLSYPRSGNTWFRYCLEFLTLKPTKGYYKSSFIDDNPLYDQISDYDDFVLIKRHETKEITKNDSLIVLVRNYKEVLIRHLGLAEAIKDENVENYMQILQFYDDFVGPKIIFYYEDLITDLRKVMEQALNFLSFPATRLNDLVENINYHKYKSLDLYSTYVDCSCTKGDVINFHSNILSIEDKKKWDGTFKSKYLTIFNRYLSRYEEL